MRPVRIITVLTAMLGGMLLSGCSTHTYLSERPTCRGDHRARSCEAHRHRQRCGDRERSRSCRQGERVEAGVRWDVVLPAPEVAREERWIDHSWNPEFGRRDASLSPRSSEPIDAVSSSWPEPWRPDLDFDRTGRTSTDPERFIYSSNRSWWHSPRRGYPVYRRWRR